MNVKRGSNTENRNSRLAKVLIVVITVGFLPLTGLAQETPTEGAPHELILPIVTTGTLTGSLHYSSTITVLNLSSTLVEGEVQLYGDRGLPLEGFCEEPDFWIGGPPVFLPADSRTIRRVGRGTQGWATRENFELRSGWARIRTNQEVAVSLELALVDGRPDGCFPSGISRRPSEEIVASTTIPAVLPATSHQFRVTIRSTRETAVAIVNPSDSETVEIEASLLYSTGRPYPYQDGFPLVRTGTLPPRSRVSSTVWDLLTRCGRFGAPCDPDEHPAVSRPEYAFNGTLLIRSSVPIAVAALDVVLPEGKIVTVPASVPDDVEP